MKFEEQTIIVSREKEVTIFIPREGAVGIQKVVEASILVGKVNYLTRRSLFVPQICHVGQFVFLGFLSH